MYINKNNIDQFGAKILEDYKYTAPTLSNSIFQGRHRSSFNVLMSNYELATLEITVVFEGKDRKDVTRKKSAFDGILYGSCNIDMEDGFSYFAYADEIGEAQYKNEALIECSYTFKCIRHTALETITGNIVNCKSTLPFTDCILTVTVSKNAINYAVGPVTFPTVTAGQILTVDGIKKRILVNGAPGANFADWLTFPSLTPGQNNIQCADILTIQYYPSFF